MVRQKPYYHLTNERSIKAVPCPSCGSEDRVEQCWCESGHGWLPDDVKVVEVCGCGRVVDDDGEVIN